MSTTDDGRRAKVDQQDGGPGSHSGDGSGGTENDVASGGVSEHAHEDDSPSRDVAADRDVHGDPETTT